MKTRIVILLSLVVSITCTNLMADVWVQGYTRRDGTRVRGHYRSDPDGNFWNNWSTVGNTNPYTGKPGWKRSPSQGFGGFNSIAGFVHRAQVIAHQQQRVACAKRAAAIYGVSSKDVFGFPAYLVCKWRLCKMNKINIYLKSLFR